MTESSDPLGLDGQRAGQHLLRQREPELDGPALERRRGLGLLRAHLGGRLASAASAGSSAASASARPAA